jgi:hypothetical protein
MMSRARAVAGALILCALTAAGCSGGKSYAVVTVRSAAGDILNVRQFMVQVFNDPGRRDMLYYPPVPRPISLPPYRLSETDSVDFSVGFSSNYLGVLRVGVAPADGEGTLGYGEAEARINPGQVIRMEVLVTRDVLPPPAPDDAGAGPACEPTSSTACGSGLTCFVKCDTSMMARGACTAAGSGQPGRACTGNPDCAPGSQCFDYACGSLCKKFCKVDADCGEGRCNTVVPCGTRLTTHRVCSQPCDPRGDGRTGCPGELRCFLFDGEIANCDCRGADRGDGESCQSVRDCQPGLLCVEMEGAVRACRPLCKLGEGGCAADRTCTQLVMPDYKSWGACLPPPP